jgi:tetratricopeptide (TPR) repeat protein
MKNNLLVSLFLTVILTFNVYAAGSSDSDSSKNKTQYDKAVSHIKAAKKFEKKNKLEKAKKRYEKAQKLLIKSNEKFPNKADTLNYLGFTTRKLGDFEKGEKYYLQGLAIDPNHKGINEYLGELYVATGRHNLAVERLGVLKNCDCKEYEDLKAIIAGEKVSKY